MTAPTCDPLVARSTTYRMLGDGSARDTRLAVGLSQRSAARVAGISYRSLNKWERGACQPTCSNATTYGRLLIGMRRLLDALEPEAGTR